MPLVFMQAILISEKPRHASLASAAEAHLLSTWNCGNHTHAQSLSNVGADDCHIFMSQVQEGENTSASSVLWQSKVVNYQIWKSCRRNWQLQKSTNIEHWISHQDLPASCHWWLSTQHLNALQELLSFSPVKWSMGRYSMILRWTAVVAYPFSSPVKPWLSAETSFDVWNLQKHGCLVTHGPLPLGHVLPLAFSFNDLTVLWLCASSCWLRQVHFGSTTLSVEFWNGGRHGVCE